jgi:HEAT repeat protein
MMMDKDGAEKAMVHIIARLRKTRVGYDDWQDAIEELAELGPDIVPRLVEALAEEEEGAARVGIRNALGKIGTLTLYDMIAMLKHASPNVRGDAAQRLYGMAVRNDGLVTDAIPALVEAVRDREDLACYRVTVALERIGEEAKEAVPALIENLLKSEYCMIREWSAKALGSIGPAAKAAVPGLTEALLDDDPWVRESASEALDIILAG